MKNPHKAAPRIISAFFLSYTKPEHMLNSAKIQKLVYYAQAWNLAMYEETLFEEPIYANENGPALKSLEKVFQEFGYKPITLSIKKPSLHRDIEGHLQDVYDTYGHLVEGDLVLMSTNEDPWRLAHHEGKKEDWSDVIQLEEIKNYYRSRLEPNEN